MKSAIVMSCLHSIVDAVESALAQPGEIERGLAQRLRRNSARVHRRASRSRRALDDANTLAEMRRLRRAFFAGGAGTDHDEIVVVGHAVAFLAGRRRAFGPSAGHHARSLEPA